MQDDRPERVCVVLNPGVVAAESGSEIVSARAMRSWTLVLSANLGSATQTIGVS